MNGHDGLVDACLALLVDQLVEVAGADLREVGNSQDEADGIEDVGLGRGERELCGGGERIECREKRVVLVGNLYWLYFVARRGVRSVAHPPLLHLPRSISPFHSHSIP